MYTVLIFLINGYQTNLIEKTQIFYLWEIEFSKIQLLDFVEESHTFFKITL